MLIITISLPLFPSSSSSLQYIKTTPTMSVGVNDISPN